MLKTAQLFILLFISSISFAGGGITLKSGEKIKKFTSEELIDINVILEDGVQYAVTGFVVNNTAEALEVNWLKFSKNPNQVLGVENKFHEAFEFSEEGWIIIYKSDVNKIRRRNSNGKFRGILGVMFYGTAISSGILGATADEESNAKTMWITSGASFLAGTALILSSRKKIYYLKQNLKGSKKIWSIE